MTSINIQENTTKDDEGHHPSGNNNDSEVHHLAAATDEHLHHASIGTEAPNVNETHQVSLDASQHSRAAFDSSPSSNTASRNSDSDSLECKQQPDDKTNGDDVVGTDSDSMLDLPEDWIESFTDDDIKQFYPDTAVRLGMPSCPGTKRWHQCVETFTKNTAKYPCWSGDVAQQIKDQLDPDGILTFFVKHEHASGPLSSSKKTKKLKNLWRLATHDEIMERTRQRFIDDRKKMRMPRYWFSIPERSVGFGWNRHPGTVDWRQVVKECSDNHADFPDWEKTIVDHVIAKLANEHYTTLFLVFRDSNNKSTNSIDDGLWVQASKKEVLEATHQEFLKNRNSLKPSPTNMPASPAGPTPDGGGGGGHSKRNHKKSGKKGGDSGSATGTTPRGNTASGGADSGQQRQRGASSHVKQDQMDMDEDSEDHSFSSSNDEMEDDYSYAWKEETSDSSDDDDTSESDDDESDDDGDDDNDGDYTSKEDDKGAATQRLPDVARDVQVHAAAYRDKHPLSTSESGSSCSSDGSDSESTPTSQKRRKLDAAPYATDAPVPMDRDCLNQHERLPEEVSNNGEPTKPRKADGPSMSQLLDKVAHMRFNDDASAQSSYHSSNHTDTNNALVMNLVDLLDSDDDDDDDHDKVGSKEALHDHPSRATSIVEQARLMTKTKDAKLNNEEITAESLSGKADSHKAASDVDNDSMQFQFVSDNKETSESSVEMETQAINDASGWSIVEKSDGDKPSMNGMPQLDHGEAPQEPIVDSSSSTTSANIRTPAPDVKSTNDNNSVDALLSVETGTAAVLSKLYKKQTFTDEQVEQRRAVCFGKPSHKDTKLWRLHTNTFSKNINRYPSWSDDMAEQIHQQLEQDGVTEYFVREEVVQKRVDGKVVGTLNASNNNKSPGKKGKKDKEQILWRWATYQEFLVRTKRRFNDDRKWTKFNDDRKQWAKMRGAEVSAPFREPVFDTSHKVCIGWTCHPATAQWLETTRRISENQKRFPLWKDGIAGVVKRQLKEDNIDTFLVIRDSDGKPCKSMEDGFWVRAEEMEIMMATKLEFMKIRNKLQDGEPPSSQGSNAGAPDSTFSSGPCREDSSSSSSLLCSSQGSNDRPPDGGSRDPCGEDSLSDISSHSNHGGQHLASMYH